MQASSIAATAKIAPEGKGASAVPRGVNRELHHRALRQGLAVPLQLATELPDDILPEVAAAMAAFDRRYGGKN